MTQKQAAAYPLAWPDGWKRTPYGAKKHAGFRTGRRSYGEGGSSWITPEKLTIATGTRRVTDELARMGARGIVISTNLALRQDGLPRSGQREPDDSGAAVYWTDRSGRPRCMAIDQYYRIADNLAAIAATLDAMRAIDRHGGAQIMERAFSGFVALPAPEAGRHWREVLEVGDGHYRKISEIEPSYRRRRSETHPDRAGGSTQAFNEVQRAFEQACAELEP
jgi:hypothetical protein